MVFENETMTTHKVADIDFGVSTKLPAADYFTTTTNSFLTKERIQEVSNLELSKWDRHKNRVETTISFAYQ